MQSTYPAALGAYLIITLLLPVLRTRLRHRVWPTVFFRSPDPIQRVMGLALGLILTGGGAWAGLVALLDPGDLGIWSMPPWTVPVGWCLVLAGAGLEMWAQASMGDSFRVGIDDRPTRLVVTGPFRLVRNPIFSGLLVSLGGFTLLAPAAWTVMGYLTAWLLLAIQTRLEERHLVRLHGEPYLTYSARVGRFVPGVGLVSRP